MTATAISTPYPSISKRFFFSLVFSLAIALTPAAALNALDQSNAFVCSGHNAADKTPAPSELGDLRQIYALFATTQVWYDPNLAASALWNGEQLVVTSVVATGTSVAISYDRGTTHTGTIAISETGEGTAQATQIDRSRNFPEMPVARFNYDCTVIYIQAMRPKPLKR